MEENITTPAHRHVRHRKTKMEVFKEAALPYLILLAATILIVTFIIGALARNSSEETETAQTAVCQEAL